MSGITDQDALDASYMQGYQDGADDTEARLRDEIAEARAGAGVSFALESIAAQIVDYFGGLAETLRELRDLKPTEVDELKRVSRDVRSPTPSATWPGRRR